MNERGRKAEWRKEGVEEGSRQCGQRGGKERETDPNDIDKKRLFTYKGKLIPFWITKKGYCRCTLNINGNKKNHLVHQLVAKAFLSNENNKPQVNHINCIKTDNTVENLEWVTNTENNLHAKANGLLYYQKL